MYLERGKILDIGFFKFKYLLLIKWNLLKKYQITSLKNLITKKKKRKGFSLFNGILVRQLKPSIFNTFFYDNISQNKWKNKPTLSVNLFKGTFKSGGLVVYSNSSGLLFLDSLTHFSLFDFYYLDIRKLLPKSIHVLNFKWLVFLKLGSKIKNLISTFNKFISYSKALGSYAIIQSYDDISGDYLIKLPSGSLKLFFLTSTAITFDSIYDKIRLMPFYFINAGTSKNFGRKSKVRGVAMNPVDHPHGGRTKSIKFQQTPWGFSSKS